MDDDLLPGGVFATIAGRVHPCRRVLGRPTITLVEGDRVVDRSDVERLFRRTISGEWRGEPVTVWAARTPGAVRVTYCGRDWDRAQRLGMRGDRTMWELDVPPSEVTVTSVDEVDLD